MPGRSEEKRPPDETERRRSVGDTRSPSDAAPGGRAGTDGRDAASDTRTPSATAPGDRAGAEGREAAGDSRPPTDDAAGDGASTGGKAAAVAIEGVHKRYGETRALAGVSLDVQPGEIHGLIGPDGAGKTTLMRIVCGLVLPDAGDVRVLGLDALGEAQQIKEHLGYMPQRFSLYPDLTVAENLRFFADLYEVGAAERRRREEQLLGFSGLGPFRGRRAGALSGGMKQKLALSCMLIHTPRVLVLDEPTTGVDVVSRREFWEILEGLARDGMALLASTPYMDEAERFDRLALMHAGAVIAAGTPGEVRGRFDGRLLAVQGREQERAWRRLRESELRGGAARVHRFGNQLHVSMAAAAPLDPLHAALAGLDVETREVAPSIEDAFVALVGRSDESDA